MHPPPPPPLNSTNAQSCHHLLKTNQPPNTQTILNRACERAILFLSARVMLTAVQAYGDDAYNPEVQFPSTARSLHRGLGFYI
jgi:hypothetical protein